MSLVELLASSRDTSRSPRRNIIHGVVVGIVQDIQDPEGLGRVKVNFPWLGGDEEATAGQEDQDRAHSYWARIATLMAGGGRGAFFVPDVGDEVLVVFEYGDPSRPFVIGALWNADDQPPESMDGEGQNNIRAIVSRSGHRIVLNDSADAPSITIVDQTGENSIFIDSTNNAMEIKVAQGMTITVGGNLTITVGGNLEIEAGQNLTAAAGQDLELSAGANGTFEAGANLDLKASANFTGEGGAQSTLKGATVSVNGSAMTEVKGGLVKIN